ncbi:MAG: ABC transporter ATP-binding protein [Rhodospirillales bacterium]
MLEIRNLHASVGDKPILRGIDITVPDGEIHAIMGPNGSGKSTLAYVLSGREDFAVTEGSVTFDGADLLAHGAGAAGPGRCVSRLPGPGRTARRRQRQFFAHRAETPSAAPRGEAENGRRPPFSNWPAPRQSGCRWPDDMLKRNVNVGFSGGEKKRNEVLQMAILRPRLAILDETDSGLDIDALRIVGDGVNALRSKQFSALVITHHQRLLDHIVPDRVHVLVNGRILRSGGPDLARALEAQGYAQVIAEAA